MNFSPQTYFSFLFKEERKREKTEQKGGKCCKNKHTHKNSGTTLCMYSCVCGWEGGARGE